VTKSPPKPKPPVNLGGLTESDVKRAKSALSKIKTNPFFDFFAHPVDPIRDGAPDYLDVIKNPMDFGTIESRLRSGGYNSVDQLEKDVDLVFTNCLTYNANPLVPFV
jgi:transcription initiation factor TFIID subunit 2